MESLLLRSIILFVISVAEGVNLTDYVSLCDVNDPGLNECVRKATQDIFDNVLENKGIPEYGIPRLEPLEVPKMVMDHGIGPVGLVLTLLKSKHYGLGIAKFRSAKADPKNYHLELDLTFDAYGIVGDYDITGRILLLPIAGSGYSNLTMYNLKSRWILDGKPMTKQGELYMDLTEFKVIINAERAYFKFENLFNGNQLLGATMNNFLNENNKDVIGELRPTIEETFSQLHLGLTKRLFEQIPYKKLFSGL